MESNEQVLGKLAEQNPMTLEAQQRNAWLEQIKILRDALGDVADGHIFFEFSIPRMGKRVDNILIIDDLVFVIEFKVGMQEHAKHAIDQVVDYALDLKNFHRGSHDKKLIPLLIASEAGGREVRISRDEDAVYEPVFANAKNLSVVLSACLGERGSEVIDAEAWAEAPYHPTPTIIEAAQALYEGHDVDEISRSESGAINLSQTTNFIRDVVEKSKRESRKSICFVTGVPGSGKTLAGLNIANAQEHLTGNENAAFLSGNGPLVEVLREALARNDVARAKAAGENLTKQDALRRVRAFVQNVHHFRDAEMESDTAPTTKVVVFDEAQRAWSRRKLASFMKLRRGVQKFEKSEPRFLIEAMDRHRDWCTVVCLVGGGQEIHTGEAGLAGWVAALRDHFPDWDVYCSGQIIEDTDYVDDEASRKWLEAEAAVESSLHLAVSIRSFRSEKLSAFVHALLDLNIERAKLFREQLQEDYPIVVTRDLSAAKRWLKEGARGTERYGIVASSSARRLRPYGIDVTNEMNPSDWFLNKKDDVRSSFYMEDVAREFHIQGLEIDWAVVAWGADLRLHENQWQYWSFKGTKWQSIRKKDAWRYLLNTYRVLLTRARQGMVIFVPEGESADVTRPPEFYDETYQYLTQDIGLPALEE